MNVAYFIARRLTRSQQHKSTISAPIIKIAISAVAIGMVMMIVSVSAGIGLQEKIRQKVSAFNGQIVISNYDENQSEVSINPISTRQDFYPNFNTVAGISHIQAVASKAGIIRTENTFEGVILKGVGRDYRWDDIDEYMVSGRHPQFGPGIGNEVMLSSFLANRLQLKTGDRFNMFFMKDAGNQVPFARNFTVSGIYDSGFHEFDATYIIGDIRQVQRMNKWTPQQVGAFEVFIDDFSQLQHKGTEVYNAIDSTLEARTIADKYGYIFEWLKLFDFNIVLIIGIMILVATINMVVALLVMILERTQMIGIIKALGGGNRFVRKIFLYNAMYLVGRGLLWGNIVALALLAIQHFLGLVKLNPENYYVNQAPVAFPWLFFVLLNIGTVAICFVVLLLPSYVISRISPARAIRFD